MMMMMMMMMMIMITIIIKSNQTEKGMSWYLDNLGPGHRCIEGQLTPSHLACLPSTSEQYVFDSIL